MARRLILVAAAAAVAGGIALFAVILLSDDDAKALTKAEYIARANAVCRVYNARLAKIDAPVAVGNPQAIARSISEALPLVVERAEKVRAIKPPAEFETRVRQMFSLSDRAIAQLRAALRHARANRVLESNRSLGMFLGFSERAKQVATGIGLSC